MLVKSTAGSQTWIKPAGIGFLASWELVHHSVLQDPPNSYLAQKCLSLWPNVKNIVDTFVNV